MTPSNPASDRNEARGILLPELTDPRPCLDCGKPHGCYQYGGKNGLASWSDPDDGHNYRPDTWESFARALATERAIGAGIDAERLRTATTNAIAAATEDGPDLSDLIAAEYARLTPQPGEPSPYAPESYMGGTADMIPVANLTPQPGEPTDE